MEKFIEINGINYCYEDLGSGEIIILIHGLSESKEAMLRYATLLGDKYRYIIPDLRGHGKSITNESYKLEDHADDIAQLIDKLNLNKVIIIGASMGSYVSLNCIEKYPNLFNKAILISTKTKGESSSIERISKEAGYDLLSIDKHTLSDLILKASLTPSNYDKYKKGEFKLDKNLSRRLSSEEKKLESESLKDFNLENDLKNITCSVCVIAMQYDKINKPSLGKELSALIKCEYHQINDASHLVILENKEELKKVILDFINKKEC